MFCRDCGKDNVNHALYCGSDGVVLHSKAKNLKLKRGSIRFCKDCGQTIAAYDVYCNNCGNSLFEKSSNAAGLGKIEKDSRNDGTYSNLARSIGQFNFKKSLSYAALGLILVLLISFTISMGINKVIQEEIAYEIGMPLEFKPANFLDIAMLLNATNLNFGIFNDYYTVIDASVSGTPFIAFLIPFLVFFSIGIFKARRKDKLNQSIDFKDIFISALFYGVLLSLLSLIANNSKEIFIPYLEQQITFKKNYAFFTTLIKGALIALMSLFLGYSLYEKFNKNKSNLGKFKELFNASFIFFIAALLVSLAVIIYSKFNLSDDLPYDIAGLFVMVQIGIYAFLMINLGTFNLIQDFDGVKISLFNNLDILKDDLGSGGVAFLFLLVLVPVLLFFMHGKKVKNTGEGNILSMSIFYSLLIGLLAYLTYGSVSGAGGSEIFDGVFNSQMSLGFKFYYSIIASFILSIVSSSAGYFLSRENEDGVIGIE